VEAELFSLREIQKESSSQAKDELLTKLDTREQRLAEATSRLQTAEAELISLKQLQGQIESRNGDLVKLEKQLQDALQQWEANRTACDSKLVEYQRGVTEQIEEKNEQIGDLQSILKQMKESSKFTLFHAVEAERQKWEAQLISQLDKATKQIATLQDTECSVCSYM